MGNVVPIGEAKRPSGWKRRRWDWVARVRMDRDLSMNAKLLAYVMITLPADSPELPMFKTGVKELANAFAASVDVVKRGLRDLEEAGWIQRSDGRGRGRQLTIAFTFSASGKSGKSAPLSGEKESKSAPFYSPENSADMPDFNDENGADTPDFRPENGADLTVKWGKSAPPPTPPYKDTISFPNSAGAQVREGLGADDAASFWAKSINAGRFVSASAVNPETAREMLRRGLVTEAALRAKGIAF